MSCWGWRWRRSPADRSTSCCRRRCWSPLGLTRTPLYPVRRRSPQPVLHAFSSERRAFFDVPAEHAYYEESTFWDPSWTITRGAIQTTNVYDLTATAVAVGEGTLLLAGVPRRCRSPRACAVSGPPVEGCGTCFTQSEGYSYGIGVVTTGNWILQNPMFNGFAAAEGYLASREDRRWQSPSRSNRPPSTADGAAANQADLLFRKIGGVLAPDDAPPIK